MTDAPEEVLLRIKKLLNKANGKGVTEAEAAAFAAKAQQLLAEHNLDVAAVERATGEDGQREMTKVEGGFYNYQRRLWRAVAELNFCMYWTMESFEKRKVRVYNVKGDRYSGTHYEEKESRTLRHRLLGRTVNVRTSLHMSQYLEEVADRLSVEATRTNGEKPFGNWAVSFREGVVSAICDKIFERRREQLSEEKRKQEEARRAAEAAGSASVASGQALVVTLASHRDAEKQANSDWLLGDGDVAKGRAKREQWAREEAEREAARVKWAAEHPEEAAAEAAALEEERKKYRARSRWRGGSSKPSKTDWSAFNRGKEAGASVSLDQQVDKKAPTARIGRA